MEEKKRIHINLLTIVLLIIILILIFALILVYYYFINQNSNSSSTMNKNILHENETNEIAFSNQIEELSINTTKSINIENAALKELYTYIPILDDHELRKTAYQSKKIVKKDLENEILLAHAFNLIDKYDIEWEFKEENIWPTFPKEVLEEKMTELHGKKTVVKHQDFSFWWAGHCFYRNGRYEYSVGGGSNISIDSIRYIFKAEYDNNQLYIYDKYMLKKTTDLIDDEGNYASDIVLYQNTEANEIIVHKAKEYIEDFESYNQTLINKYISEMTEYKHTFKKNEDGTYYWYSSEPI